MPGRGPDPKSTNTHQFETGRLEVDIPRPEDAPILYEMLSDDQRHEVCSTLVWDGPNDLAEVENWVGQCNSSSFDDWGFHWVIRDRLGTFHEQIGQPLGAIGTRRRETPGRADVGYWLGRPYWGNGIMTESLNAVLGYGFDRLDFTKIEADVFTHNTRGRRLVEKVGMTQEGTIRCAQQKYGEWVDVALYGLVADEWRATG